MTKKIRSKIVLSALVTIGLTTGAFAQNWQYVGAPYINQTVGTSTYLYFPDMEFNAAGEIFIGYWKYSGELCFAKYSSGSWTQLPSPGTFPVNNVDVEIQGSDYYIAYSGVRGSNMYAFVQKYNGSSWSQLGDSLLLGNSGSGGYFDFLVDNNGVPTLLGVVSSTIAANKQVMQYSGSNWSSIYTFANSAATVFRENSGIFDSQNKLLTATQGYVTVPAFQYFTLINKLDGSICTTVGDTIYGSLLNQKIKLDANGISYLCGSAITLSKVMAYKLVGPAWSFVADTAAEDIGTMLSADVAGDGKIFFNTQAANLNKSIFYFDNSTRYAMDSLNINGFGVGAVSDLVIPESSGDVYVLILEIKTGGVQDLSVMKHALTGTSDVADLTSFNEPLVIYPNPSNGSFILQKNTMKDHARVKIYNISGEIIFQTTLIKDQQMIDISRQSKGLYFLGIDDGTNIYTRKIVVQ